MGFKDCYTWPRDTCLAEGVWVLFSDFAGQVRRNSQSISELDCYGY